ncbi:hypothetical protein [Acinetobacter oleivorans]|uniref:hypothetical protein n=1 Tax=Acinetobacter oleivorans TaxID=1148157 RepID=UPI0019005BA1|nr:hypothetical protein [Acinetobacter oleivorans]MBJ8499598.1 hypothetical protein [Acinetobacter oleivorans]
MKKIILFLSLTVCTNLFAITVDDLGYKSIFRTFYPNMFYVSMEDNDYDGNELPKAGIKETKKEYLALMYPVEQYKNANHEDRYIVLIKKREIDKDSYTIINGKWKKIDSNTYKFSDTCHACSSAKADIYIFKKSVNNKYDLVSRTSSNFSPPSAYGDLDLNVKGVGDRIVKTGINEVGFFDDSFSYTNYGTTDNLLYLIRLNESKISGYHIDLSSGTNDGEYESNSPLSYEYSSVYKTLESQTSQVYPVEMRFKGDVFNEKTGKIENYNKIKRFKYNPMKDKYELISETDY